MMFMTMKSMRLPQILLCASTALALTCQGVSATTILEVDNYKGNSDRGEQQYNINCSSCHSPDTNFVGPAHRGVFGRHAGRAEGYEYSEALQKTDVVWTADNLFKWLEDPEAFIPGQMMNVSFEDPQLRADVIAYLSTLTEK